MTQPAPDSTANPALTILLAAPRGFCAGVERAIEIVEKALQKYGPPVYVRHEIVHNKYVVDSLKQKGAVFVEDLSDIPKTGQPVVFSAHGVPKSVPAEADARNIFYLDATCPLVTKVHRDAEHHHAAGHQVILIGHKGHPEVIGTMGQLPESAVVLIETRQDAEAFQPHDPAKLAYTTQTTLSVDETAKIIAILKRRFPDIQAPHKEDICYATTNRQQAVKAIAAKCDALLVVGAPNSSNSKQLVAVAKNNGCKKAYLVQRADDIDWRALKDVRTLGLTAGASAPEALIQEVIEACAERGPVQVEEIAASHESMKFNIPKQLRD